MTAAAVRENTREERFFRIVLILKGLDGILELIGGVLLLVAGPRRITGLVQLVTQHELSQDPHDFVATHLLSATSHLSTGATLFGALYLLSHGVVKIVLVWAVLRDKLWAYPWMVAFLLVFIVYQVYRLAIAITVGLLLLTLFDILVTVLTVREYRRLKHRLAAERATT
jgi:uncharacterized membrane protein